MSTRNLITGITGFVGSHLAEHLLQQGQAVMGFSRSGCWVWGAEHLEHFVRVEVGNASDPQRVRTLLHSLAPDRIYHLAGQADTRLSESDADAAARDNADATQVVVEAAAEVLPGVPVLVVSSGAVYGQVPIESFPITEQTNAHPEGVYARTKYWAEQRALETFHRLRQRTPLVLARPFNHIGPRQSPRFAVSAFARQIASQEHRGYGRPDQPIRLIAGNLHVRRDFTDVRDVVAGYRLLLDSVSTVPPMLGPGTVVNLASGQSRLLSSVVTDLIRVSGRAVELQTDERLFRPFEPPEWEVNPYRLRNLGWAPLVPWEQTLLETLDYWRNRTCVEPPPPPE